ncbi:kinase-like protein [Suillus hirtellus]|nr:kinase-like protein [Suillus hirtellus]
MVKMKAAREGREEKLQKACQRFRENQLNGHKLQILQVATYYGVLQSTLCDQFNGAHLLARKAHRDQQLLSEEKEKCAMKNVPIQVDGRFRLGDMLGSGLYGVVYHAWNIINDDEFAVKLEPLINNSLETVSRPPEKMRSTATADPIEKELLVLSTAMQSNNTHQVSKGYHAQVKRGLGTVLGDLPTTEWDCKGQSPLVEVLVLADTCSKPSALSALSLSFSLEVQGMAVQGKKAIKEPSTAIWNTVSMVYGLAVYRTYLLPLAGPLVWQPYLSTVTIRTVYDGDGGVGILGAVWFSREATYDALVLDLLGPSLHDIFLMCNRKFDFCTILNIRDQLLSSLEHIHLHNYVHGDIKAQNILIGHGTSKNSIFIVDFGVAKGYWSSTTQAHMPFCQD